jgi:hypothetical protein
MKNTTGAQEPRVDPERLARFLAPDVHLRAGAGNGANGEIDTCVMQAVDWLRGGDGKTDTPPCASPVIGRYCTRLNDSALFAMHRDLLKPYAPKIVGTRASDKIEVQRGLIAADNACRVFAPIAFRAYKHEDWATECEALAPITDRATAKAARDVLRKIQYAAYAATDADAAAYAAYAAYADAAAAAATDADAAAADAAYAAYAATDADAAAAAAAYAAYAATDADAAAAAAYAADAAAAAYARDAALRCLDQMLAVGQVAV